MEIDFGYALVDYKNRKRNCFFCSTDISVKYDASFKFKGKDVTVACCNMCAAILKYKIEQINQ